MIAHGPTDLSAIAVGDADVVAVSVGEALVWSAAGPTYAPATAAPGEPRDAHHVDLGTANEPDWTRALLLEPSATNRMTWSEPTLAQAATGYTTGVTEGPGGYGFARSIVAPSGATTVAAYAPMASVAQGVTCTLSLWVVMDAGDAPVVGARGPTTDFTLAHHTTTIDAAPTVRHVRDDVYRVDVVYAVPVTGTRAGFIRYSNQTGRGFRVLAFQHVEGSAPSSYLPTYGAPASRGADDLHFAPAPAPQALTLYTDLVVGSPLEPGAPVSRFLGIIGAVPNRFQLVYDTVGRVQATFHNGTGTATALTAPVSFAVGDRIRLRGALYADGSASLEIRTNEGAPVSAGPTAPPSGGLAGVVWSEDRVGPHLPGQEQYTFANSRLALDVYAGDVSFADCGATRGDLYSFRPSEGDTVAALGGTFSRASAATYTAEDPAPLPDGAPGDFYIDPAEAYVGGRVPVRDHQGNQIGTAALVQGIDNAVGTSDPTLTRAGWSLDGGDSLRLDLTGALDVARTASGLVVAMTTSDSEFIAAYDSSQVSRYVMAALSGSLRPDSNAGTPTYAADGVVIASTRSAVSAAWATGAPVVAEARGADLSLWTSIALGNWNGTFPLTGTVHAIAGRLSATPASAAERALRHARVSAMCARRGVALPALP